MKISKTQSFVVQFTMSICENIFPTILANVQVQKKQDSVSEAISTVRVQVVPKKSLLLSALLFLISVCRLPSADVRNLLKYYYIY